MIYFLFLSYVLSPTITFLSRFFPTGSLFLNRMPPMPAYAAAGKQRKKKRQTRKERKFLGYQQRKKIKLILIIFDLKIRTKRCYVKKQEHIFSEHYISKIYLNRIPSRFHLKKIGIESLFYCARRTY